MMNCEQCRELLPDLERTDLSATAQAAIDAHLRSCAACTKTLAALRELSALLDSEAVPSPALRAQVLARLEQESTGRNVRCPSALALWFATLWPSRPVGAFSYSLVLVLCGVLSGQLLPRGTLGVGSGPEVADIPAERLVQLCAVPTPPPNAIL